MKGSNDTVVFERRLSVHPLDLQCRVNARYHGVYAGSARVRVLAQHVCSRALPRTALDGARCPRGAAQRRGRARDAGPCAAWSHAALVLAPREAHPRTNDPSDTVRALAPTKRLFKRLASGAVYLAVAAR